MFVLEIWLLILRLVFTDISLSVLTLDEIPPLPLSGFSVVADEVEGGVLVVVVEGVVSENEVVVVVQVCWQQFSESQHVDCLQQLVQHCGW